MKRKSDNRGAYLRNERQRSYARRHAGPRIILTEVLIESLGESDDAKRLIFTLFHAHVGGIPTQ